jgi:hypothetical protein
MYSLPSYHNKNTTEWNQQVRVNKNILPVKQTSSEPFNLVVLLPKISTQSEDCHIDEAAISTNENFLRSQSSRNKDINTSYSTNNSIHCLLLSKTVFNPEKGNVLTTKCKNNTRILHQKINSLQPKTDTKWKATLDCIHHLEADSIGLCETSVN